jgi:Tfp pilus assembly protein PilN
MKIPSELKKILAFGSGVGIEIGGPAGAESLRVTAVRVRPGSVRVLGTLEIPDVSQQTAGVWGTEYGAFVRRHGLAHVGATVLLPRRDVIVRQIQLPGVADQDLAAAVEFQMDGLHPFAEGDAVSSWARLPGSPAVMVAITRRSVMERFLALFGEAGVKVGCFSCSAAAIYSARRIFGDTVAPELLAFEPAAGSHGIEVYGESPVRPVFSAAFDLAPERALALAGSELRLPQEMAARSFDDVFQVAAALPYAAGISSACPAHVLDLNLLPADQRQATSSLLWIPSVALAAAIVILAVALGFSPEYQNRAFVKSLEAEIAKLQPATNQSSTLDKQIETARRRTATLIEFRSRSKQDMDVLSELTRILPPPTWLNSLEVTRTQINLAGETEQTAPLLRVIDDSALFQNSEFASPPMRLQGGEAFRIRTQRVVAENAGDKSQGQASVQNSAQTSAQTLVPQNPAGQTPSPRVAAPQANPAPVRSSTPVNATPVNAMPASAANSAPVNNPPAPNMPTPSMPGPNMPAQSSPAPSNASGNGMPTTAPGLGSINLHPADPIAPRAVPQGAGR